MEDHCNELRLRQREQWNMTSDEVNVHLPKLGGLRERQRDSLPTGQSAATFEDTIYIFERL